MVGLQQIRRDGSHGVSISPSVTWFTTVSVSRELTGPREAQGGVSKARHRLEDREPRSRSGVPQSYTRGLRRRRRPHTLFTVTRRSWGISQSRAVQPINGACQHGGHPRVPSLSEQGVRELHQRRARRVTAAASNSVKHFDEGGRLLIRRKKGKVCEPRATYRDNTRGAASRTTSL